MLARTGAEKLRSSQIYPMGYAMKILLEHKIYQDPGQYILANRLSQIINEPIYRYLSLPRPLGFIGNQNRWLCIDKTQKPAQKSPAGETKVLLPSPSRRIYQGAAAQGGNEYFKSRPLT